MIIVANIDEVVADNQPSTEDDQLKTFSKL